MVTPEHVVKWASRAQGALAPSRHHHQTLASQCIIQILNNLCLASCLVLPTYLLIPAPSDETPGRLIRGSAEAPGRRGAYATCHECRCSPPGGSARRNVIGDVSAPRRNSQCMCHRVCESLCESFVAPSAFRQALPANGADGEAPLKVVGLRGARAARAKPRTCFGRRLDGGFSE